MGRISLELPEGVSVATISERQLLRREAAKLIRKWRNDIWNTSPDGHHGKGMDLARNGIHHEETWWCIQDFLGWCKEHLARKHLINVEKQNGS